MYKAKGRTLLCERLVPMSQTSLNLRMGQSTKASSSADTESSVCAKGYALWLPQLRELWLGNSFVPLKMKGRTKSWSGSLRYKGLGVHVEQSLRGQRRGLADGWVSLIFITRALRLVTLRIH